MAFLIGAMLESFGCSAAEALEQCARLGVDGVQFYGISGELDAGKQSSAFWKSFACRLRDTRLAVSAVCADLGGHGFAFEAENEHRIQKSLQAARLARRLDCGVVTTHIGVIPPRKTKIYTNMQRVCSKLGQEASKIGVKFAAETGPEESAVMAAFLRSLDTDSFCVNFDPANIVMVTGEDVLQAVARLDGFIVHTHAKDGVMLKQTDPAVIYDFFAQGGIGDLRLGDYFLETPLGQGRVPFPAYLQALDQAGYHGYLTVERETGAHPPEDIRLAVAYLRGLLSQRREPDGTI